MAVAELTPEQEARRVSHHCVGGCGTVIPEPAYSWEERPLYCSETTKACRTRAYRERRALGTVRTQAVRQRQALQAALADLQAELQTERRHLARVQAAVASLVDRIEAAEQALLPQLPLTAARAPQVGQTWQAGELRRHVMHVHEDGRVRWSSQPPSVDTVGRTSTALAWRDWVAGAELVTLPPTLRGQVLQADGRVRYVVAVASDGDVQWSTPRPAPGGQWVPRQSARWTQAHLWQRWAWGARVLVQGEGAEPAPAPSVCDEPAGRPHVTVLPEGWREPQIRTRPTRLLPTGAIDVDSGAWTMWARAGTVDDVARRIRYTWEHSAALGWTPDPVEPEAAEGWLDESLEDVQSAARRPGAHVGDLLHHATRVMQRIFLAGWSARLHAGQAEAIAAVQEAASRWQVLVDVDRLPAWRQWRRTTIGGLVSYALQGDALTGRVYITDDPGPGAGAPAATVAGVTVSDTGDGWTARVMVRRALTAQHIRTMWAEVTGHETAGDARAALAGQEYGVSL